MYMYIQSSFTNRNIDYVMLSGISIYLTSTGLVFYLDIQIQVIILDARIDAKANHLSLYNESLKFYFSFKKVSNPLVNGNNEFVFLFLEMEDVERMLFSRCCSLRERLGGHLVISTC